MLAVAVTEVEIESEYQFERRMLGSNSEQLRSLAARLLEQEADMGAPIGVLPTGPLNTIADVAGVLVGQTTIVRGDNLLTGRTATLRQGGNLFREKVPGAVFVGSAFGKLAGSTPVNELGEIGTTILLTCTLGVPHAADSLIECMLAVPGERGADVRQPAGRRNQ
jgi:D-aminopeptidase